MEGVLRRVVVTTLQDFVESLQQLDEETSKYGSQLSVSTVYLSTAPAQGNADKDAFTVYAATHAMLLLSTSVAKILQNPVQLHTDYTNKVLVTCKCN